MPYLKILRFPNLILVALTQVLIYFVWMKPVEQTWLNDDSILLARSFFLQPLEFCLLIFCTLCITASGNIINDIFDQKTDQLNPLKKRIVGVSISEKSAKTYYWLLVLSGFIVAIYLAITTLNIPWLILYPAAIYLLWIYSRHLKCKPVLGNLLVSLFCAFVIGIVWFANRRGLETISNIDPTGHAHLTRQLSFYMAFAFITTLFRELIKDVEDLPGDLKAGCQTLAVKAGVDTSKRWVFGVAFASIGLIIYSFSTFATIQPLLLFFPVWGTILYCLFLVVRARETNDFKQISTLAKFIILLGLLLFPILNP